MATAIPFLGNDLPFYTLSGRRDSNPRFLAPKASVIPTSLLPELYGCNGTSVAFDNIYASILSPLLEYD